MTHAVWHRPRPKGLGAPKKLSASAKAGAKREAERSGSVYPSLVANMRAARKMKRGGRS